MALAQAPGLGAEMRHQPGYSAVIDGIAVEELFLAVADRRCVRIWCAENLADSQARHTVTELLPDVEHVTRPPDVVSARSCYDADGFAARSPCSFRTGRPHPAEPRKGSPWRTIAPRSLAL